MAIAAGLASCGRRAESAAAERAQDSCIAALAPVAEGRPPASAVLREAVADAEAAARVDRRWLPLRARLRAVRDTAGGPDAGASIAALVEECERVNGIIRREQGRDGSGPA